MYHIVASMYGNMGRWNKPIRLRLQEKQELIDWVAVASQKCCQRGKKVLVHWCLVSEALIWSFEVYTTASHIIILWCCMLQWTPLTSISLSLKSAIDPQLPFPLSLWLSHFWVSGLVQDPWHLFYFYYFVAADFPMLVQYPVRGRQIKEKQNTS